MAEFDMSFVDAIQLGRSLTILQKQVRDQIEEHMNTMPFPESADTAMRETAKIWVRHYMNGACSLESLNNLMMHMGFSDMFRQRPHELEVDKDGKLKIYEVQKRGDTGDQRGDPEQCANH